MKSGASVGAGAGAGCRQGGQCVPASGLSLRWFHFAFRGRHGFLFFCAGGVASCVSLVVADALNADGTHVPSL